MLDISSFRHLSILDLFDVRRLLMLDIFVLDLLPLDEKFEWTLLLVDFLYGRLFTPLDHFVLDEKTWNPCNICTLS